MYSTPEEISIGDSLSQKEIEEAFDTGFGYRISGINPRRDGQDQRYVLVFANEDGPYDDSVTQGQFEYIGEGLEGDQSEKSPGNSVLIDAVSSDFPVFFFYKEQESPEWEYQGQVDVFDYQFEKRNDRLVLVFDMEHRDESPPPEQTPGLYLIPVNDDWRERFRIFVEEQHDMSQYDRLPQQLDGIGQLRIWGTTETDGDKKQSAIDQMRPTDLLLFYHDGDFVAGGTVVRTFEDSDTGELLWNNPESRYLFIIENFTHNVPTIEKVWDLLGYKGRQVVQGFSRVADERVSAILEDGESLKSVLLETRDAELSAEVIKQEKSELELAVESEPQLTEDSAKFTETRRRARDQAFVGLVKDAYNYSCAICGSSRETPAGNSEVEAAHIYPKRKGGSDDVRNGIALCKLHHWAFDTGWLAISDEHKILVKDAPNRDGYYEFKQLEGDSIQLPERSGTEPDPIFLREHRQLNEF